MIQHHKPECPVKKIGLLHSRSRSQWRVKMLMFVQLISSKPPNILLPDWYCVASLWVRVSCKKIDLLFSWSRSLQELVWSKYDHFYCIFWTADPFATTLGLIVLYHKPECFMEKFDCCVQGQGHSKISKCQWMFVQMIFSELRNLLQPTKLGMVMHHYELDCRSKRLVCCLQGEGHN